MSEAAVRIPDALRARYEERKRALREQYDAGEIDLGQFRAGLMAAVKEARTTAEASARESRDYADRRFVAAMERGALLHGEQYLWAPDQAGELRLWMTSPAMRGMWALVR